MDSNKVKHLEMVEAIIERMERNCFQLKGWTMTLVTVVGALWAKESDKRFLVLAVVPIIGFWLLDAFYLQQERKYNALYRYICGKKEDEFDFNLNAKSISYMPAKKQSVLAF